MQGAEAPAIGGKALEITAEIEPSGADGVVITQGGAARGYAIYLTQGKLAFAVRESKALTTITAKEPLGTGHFTVKATLHADGAMSLFVDDKQVAEGKTGGPNRAATRRGALGRNGRPRRRGRLYCSESV